MRDKATEEYYRYRAPEYEQIYYRDNPARRKEIEDEATYIRKLVTKKEVLDIACGTGYWTHIAAETAKNIIACDLAREMITEARKKNYRKSPFFVIADLEQLPFADNAFDIILLGFWFSHQPKQSYHTLFSTIKRLLRDNGHIWLIDNNPPAEGSNQHSAYKDNHGNNYKRRFLDNGKEFIILKNYFSRQELIQIFQHHFSVERITYNTYYWSVTLAK